MLPQNKDLYEATFKGENFEECLGILAAQLGIALNGYYDAGNLCGVLLERMRSRRITTVVHQLLQ